MVAVTTTTAIFIISFLFCSTFSSACIPCGQPPPPPKPKACPPPPKPKLTPPPAPKSKSPPPAPKPKSPPPPKPKSPPPVPITPAPVTPAPVTPAPAPTASCPKDTLKLGACADLLGGIIGIVVGTPISSKCCTLLTGLADLEAAICLCTAIKANVLGINLNVPVTLSLIISACEKNVPPGFKCE